MPVAIGRLNCLAEAARILRTLAQSRANCCPGDSTGVTSVRSDSPRRFSAAATLSGGLLVFPAAWGALKKLRLDINILMAVAVTGAWIIGEGAEAASVRRPLQKKPMVPSRKSVSRKSPWIRKYW